MAPSVESPSETGQSKVFQHEPFADPSQQIRLLKLAPGADDDPIECSLLVVDFACQNDTPERILEDSFEYFAISYTWGDASLTREISIDGMRHPVTQNCFYALWQARHTKPEALVWIDAICIDQSNNEEKSSQVGSMWEIYKHATSTFISLGPHRDDSEYVYYVFDPRQPWAEDIMRDWSHAWQNPNVDISRLIRAAKAFQRRSYWRRMWVVQEIRSSKSSICLCGPDSLDEERLRRPWTSGFMYHYETSKGVPSGHEDRAMTSVLNQRSAWQIYRGKADLMDMLNAFKTFECSDLRDRFYSMLPFIDKGHMLRPDYSLSCFELAKKIIELDIFDSKDADIFEDRHLVTITDLIEALGLTVLDPDIASRLEPRLSPEGGSTSKSDVDRGITRTSVTMAYLFTLEMTDSRHLNGSIPIYLGLDVSQSKPGWPSQAIEHPPLLIDGQQAGWICTAAREGDILVCSMPERLCDEDPVRFEFLHLVLRRVEPQSQYSTSVVYQIVGLAVIIREFHLNSADYQTFERWLANQTVKLQFDAEDVLIYLVQSRPLRRWSESDASEKLAIIGDALNTRVTRRPFSSYAVPAHEFAES